MTPKERLYSQPFFREQCDGSLRSAQRVLPIVMNLIQPLSLIDVGCGVGTWLAAASQLGVTDYLGIDGAYVSSEMLQIDKGHFRAVDLANGIPKVGEFDLAICLEVAEHLPEEAALRLVSDLTSLAPAVLFSAAIPGQTGTGHINEQWQEYWVDAFQRHQYLAIDCVRPVVWNDSDVQYWYAQNVFLMADAEFVQKKPNLREAHEKTVGPFSMVHPKTFENCRAQLYQTQSRGIRGWLGEGPSVLSRTFERRTTRHQTGSKTPAYGTLSSRIPGE